MKKENIDMTCLAKEQVFSINPQITKINANEVILGSTGTGKTTSVALSRLLHTYNSSLIIPVAKRGLIDLTQNLMKKRDYKVEVLDLSNPSKSTIGFDPLKNIKTDADAMNLARKIVIGFSRRTLDDEYWQESAIKVLQALLLLLLENSKISKRPATFNDFMTLYDAFKPDLSESSGAQSNIDFLFEECEKFNSKSNAKNCWKTIKNLSSKTASCILSYVYKALAYFQSEELRTITSKPSIDFEIFNKKKTVLYIVTNPFNESLNLLLNIFYEDLISSLFKIAENNKDNTLKIPIHIIFDDFAATGKILDFDKYISIFRSAGISVSILLQSESQLAATYYKDAATTIINNCDTILYMGGMDTATIRDIAQRINKPVKEISELPLEQIVLIRRGSKAVIAKRYQTYDDPVYKTL